MVSGEESVESRGFHPAVPSDDLVIIANQDGVGEAEPLDAFGIIAR